MKNKITVRKNQKGFTLIEIMTAVGIVAVLLALLIPALGLVRETAMEAKQRAQFHAIDISLETFKLDYGDYPESTDNQRDLALGTHPHNDLYYCGAQKLAEAVVGWDGFGFHRDSIFDAAGQDWNDELVYLDWNDPTPPTQDEIDDNIAERTGPYIELEKANATLLNDIVYDWQFNDAGWNNGIERETFILSDMYGATKNITTDKKAGMPILYYKSSGKPKHVPGSYDYALGTGVQTCTFNVLDNASIVYIDTQNDTVHPMNGYDSGDWALFYQMTSNPNYTNPQRPYNAETYILQSAGPDGLYGSMDDVFNFEKQSK